MQKILTGGNNTERISPNSETLNLGITAEEFKDYTTNTFLRFGVERHQLSAILSDNFEKAMAKNDIAIQKYHSKSMGNHCSLYIQPSVVLSLTMCVTYTASML